MKLRLSFTRGRPFGRLTRSTVSCSLAYVFKKNELLWETETILGAHYSTQTQGGITFTRSQSRSEATKDEPMLLRCVVTLRVSNCFEILSLLNPQLISILQAESGKLKLPSCYFTRKWNVKWKPASGFCCEQHSEAVFQPFSGKPDQIHWMVVVEILNTMYTLKRYYIYIYLSIHTYAYKNMICISCNYPL